MSSEIGHHSHKKEYFIVFVVLAALTILEIWVAESGMNYGPRASALVFLALGKAFVVAYYYMHLKDETRWLKFIAALPCAAFLYAGGLLLEMWSR